MYILNDDTEEKDGKKKPSLFSSILSGITSTAGSILDAVGTGIGKGMTNQISMPSNVISTPEIKPDYTPLIIGGVGVVGLVAVALLFGRKQ